MWSKLMTSLLFISFTLFGSVFAIWPAPVSFTKGKSFLFLRQNLQVTYNGAYLPVQYGFEPWKTFDTQQIVQAGVARALNSVFKSDFVPWMLHKRNALDDFEPDLRRYQTPVKVLQIVQTEKDKPSTFKPQAGTVDESYTVTLGEDGTAKITAASYVGVLWGLETFAQLFYKHSDGNAWYTPYAPVTIKDSPKFPHRGVLFDIARSWYELEDIKRTIDAMSWNKMNRLHLHITDSQAWPLVIPSMPELHRKGAYRPDLAYDPDDIEMIHKYAINRGIEVILEIDMPGHIASLARSHPELITAYEGFPYYWWCAEPPCGALKLNDKRVDTFLENLFADLLPRLAPYTAYFHTGGDELNANDSKIDPGIMSNKSEVLQPLLQKFITAQHARVRKNGLTPMVWEEIPNDWNVTIGKDTVVQAWLGSDSVKKLTGMGLKVIDSDYNFWYLDCGRGQWMNFENGEAYDTFYPFDDWCGPQKNWRLIYAHDPIAGLTPAEAKLVLGGEVAVWSETIDSQNLDNIVWPRASAAGEVLWSGRQDASGKNRSQLEAVNRLAEFREVMVARGLTAAPITMIFCNQAENATECSNPMKPGY